jgi:hypothetical protein
MRLLGPSGVGSLFAVTTPGPPDERGRPPGSRAPPEDPRG